MTEKLETQERLSFEVSREVGNGEKQEFKLIFIKVILGVTYYSYMPAPGKES